MSISNERARYDAWWALGPGRPCETCKLGDTANAASIRLQGLSFYPMHNFGPDRASVPVRYLFVAEEPSEAGFDAKLQQGRNPEDSRNFGGTTAGRAGDSALQFAAREWLCATDETFLLTDMAKCAVRDARHEPRERHQYRWQNCAPILQDEAKLFDLRAVIAVGGKAHGALREQSWVTAHRLFKVMHWAARSAHQEKVLESAADRTLPKETVDRFEAVINERRVMVGKQSKQLKIGRPAKAMLAVYREQFASIRRELSESASEGGPVI
jgi:hypothetical protein